MMFHTVDRANPTNTHCKTDVWQKCIAYFLHSGTADLAPSSLHLNFTKCRNASTKWVTAIHTGSCITAWDSKRTKRKVFLSAGVSVLCQGLHMLHIYLLYLLYSKYSYICYISDWSFYQLLHSTLMYLCFWHGRSMFLKWESGICNNRKAACLLKSLSHFSSQAL